MATFNNRASSRNSNMALAAVLLAHGIVGCGAFSTNTATPTSHAYHHHNPPQTARPITALPMSSYSNDSFDDIWNVCRPVRVQGKSLKTFPVSATSERVQVSIKSCGRPTEANVEFWESPSYIPTKFTVGCEDASENIVHTIIEKSPNRPATIAVYNTEVMDFPLEVSVAETSHASARESFAGIQPELIQGGKVKSYNFGPDVEYVEVFLATQKRDMKAYIEILQGPNDDNEIIEVDCKDGYDHPFYTIIQTGGGANTLRIINQNSLEFPFDAYVRPSNGGVSVSDGSAGKGPGPYF